MTDNKDEAAPLADLADAPAKEVVDRIKDNVKKEAEKRKDEK